VRAPREGTGRRDAPARLSYAVAFQPPAERDHALPTKVLRIGRGADNDVVVSDLSVSRYTPSCGGVSGYEIVDLGSHNGTFVNGQRISSRRHRARHHRIGQPHSGWSATSSAVHRHR